MMDGMKFYAKRRIDAEMRLYRMQAEGAGGSLEAKQLELALAWDELVHPFRFRVIQLAAWILDRFTR